MNYPPTIKNLIECYKKLPGIGEKTAERLALSTITMEENVVDLFSVSLIDSKTKIKRCEICNHLTESEKCDICLDNTRISGVLCVVEDPKNVIAFEKIGTFKGKYHVLNGLISPLDGITPEDIKINLLVSRIEKEKIDEIIFALKPSIEGETTILYITKILSGTPVKITKIAHGIPMGADMEYVDLMTLETALDNRTEVS
jgi:recombination protein RecR